MSSGKKLLVFVVAYEAEATLAKVLARIPATLSEYETEILVIDDSSADRSFEVGLEASRACSYPVTVLFNSENQGYGGNQKLGYAYAIHHGFDVVVLLHGDGQYAPECIEDLVRPIFEDRADAVFGSRMLSPGGARRGGMPLYKWIGNRVLTRIQNAVLGSALSEFHSGYRAYRVATLARLPFHYNSNVFHFDTDIIIQLMLGGERIAEVPIPTYYGDEICRVNGIRYARDVLASTVGSRLHLMNLFYDRRFDVAEPSNSHYDVKLGFESSHTAALHAVAPGSRVLDIGCGPGTFDRHLVNKGCRVVGVDQFPPEDRGAFEDFVIWDEGRDLDVRLNEYDYVLLLDIIEHLKKPEQLLERLRDRLHTLRRRPTFIVTTGNVAFLIIRLQVLLGNMNYGKQGILDLTHTRLFTFASLRRLFEQCGYRVEEVRGIPAPFPKAIGHNVLSRALVWANQALIRVSKGLFSYQIYMTAVPLPTLDTVLNDSLAVSRARADRFYGDVDAKASGDLLSASPTPANSAKTFPRSS
jgi:glycosyltransferase involved in cell wall biosynthesis